MSDQKKTRTVRPVAERIQEYENTIKFHEDAISKLRAKIEKLQNPTPRRGRVGMATVLKKAKEAGISPDQLLQMIQEKE